MKNRLIPFLMALFGFSSCSGAGPESDNGRVEYGTPRADYSIKGKVTDESGNGIPEIRVDHEGTSVKTSADGKYALEFEDFPGSSVRLNYTDTDGEANGGEFAPAELEIRFSDADLDETEADGWYRGRHSRENVDVRLSLKKKK